MQTHGSTTRAITRNRPLLSCLPCRRRKVKCGKQQPTCESCKKIGEFCVYASGENPPGKSVISSKRNIGTSRDEDPRANEELFSESADPDITLTDQPTTHSLPQSLAGLKGQVRRAESPGKSPFNSGLFHAESGSRTRYVESTFWASVKGDEKEATDLISGKYFDRTGTNAIWPHIDVVGLGNLRSMIPNKIVCDFLLRSFLICVRPVLPLIHEHSFRKNYDNYFHLYDKPDAISDENIIEDPTLIAAIFSVLYCGAVAAPSRFWEDRDVEGVNPKELIGRLSSAYTTSISCCRGGHYPTLHTLTALVLAESCSQSKETTCADVGLVSVMVKLAQSLGLHRERYQQRLDAISAELRRRLYWHILCMDMNLSISAGSTTCHYASGMDTAMIKDVRDRDLSAESKDTDPLFLPVGPSAPSIVFSTARFEVVRSLSPLVEILHSSRPLGQDHLDSFLRTLQLLHNRLDDLIAKVPARGAPERGFIPTRISSASPISNPQLYDENVHEATVIGCWIRIMIHLMKVDSAITLLKACLGEVPWASRQGMQLWTNTTRCCCDTLRIFLQVHATPAFEPFKWFYPSRFQLLQPSFLVLAYIKRSTSSSLTNTASHLIDEVLDIQVPEELSRIGASDASDSTSQNASSEWRMLRSLRKTQNSEDKAHRSDPDAEAISTPRLNVTDIMNWSNTFATSLGY